MTTQATPTNGPTTPETTSAPAASDSSKPLLVYTPDAAHVGTSIAPPV